MSTADEPRPVKGIVSLPYLVYTKRGYMVTGPDKDGEIEIENEGCGCSCCLYLSAEDLRMMLGRIERANK